MTDKTCKQCGWDNTTANDLCTVCEHGVNEGVMPWDEHSHDNASQEQATMSQDNQPLDVQTALETLFGGLSEYPLQNVMQRVMQTLVSQIGRAQHLADRIEMGDEAVADMRGQRPDADGHEQRQLSEKQLEIIMRCADDEAAAVDALHEFKTYYVGAFGEQPQYSLRQDGLGKWHPITDFLEAVANEYRNAHQAWERKNAAPADAEQTAGVQHLLAQRRAQARNRASGL